MKSKAVKALMPIITLYSLFFKQNVCLKDWPLGGSESHFVCLHYGNRLKSQSGKVSLILHEKTSKKTI